MSPNNFSYSRIAIVIVAAGKGERLGSSVPKQYLPLYKDHCILTSTIAAFKDHLPSAFIQCVIGQGDFPRYEQAVKCLPPLLPPILGGTSRQESVLNGLRALKNHKPDVVLIHDGARPFISPPHIDSLLTALTTHRAAILALPVVDTLKREQVKGFVSYTVDRHQLWRAQTPQAFHFNHILQLHEQSQTLTLTDDASICEAYNLPVHLVLGCETNLKITTSSDYEKALIMVQNKRLADIRVGQGIDVHATEPGDGIWLMGIFIPAPFRLIGHSDADVGLHSLCDALFGAIADGDIGSHFPPSDPQWKGADSKKFLHYAAQRVKEKGGTIQHVDVTILGERPKVSPHKDKMRQCVAGILEISLDRVSVKATTTEKLGFIGREEGLMAMATATVAF